MIRQTFTQIVITIRSIDCGRYIVVDKAKRWMERNSISAQSQKIYLIFYIDKYKLKELIIIMKYYSAY